MIEPAWIAAGIATLVLLLQIYRFTNAFAEKNTVTKTADELRELVEHTAVARGVEVTDLFKQVQKTLDELLAEAKVSNGRMRKLEDWTLEHEVEDRTSQKALQQGLDRLAPKRRKRVVR